MSQGVEFEEIHSTMQHQTMITHSNKSVSAYLIQNGWAHDQKSANRILVFVAILFVLASGIIYYLFVFRVQQTQYIQLPENIVKKFSIENQERLKSK